MQKFGLIGYPLTHSFSQKYFTEKFKSQSILNTSYQNYPIKNIDALMGLIKQETNLVGLNVTIPYKELVLPFLDEIDTDAKEIAAVNTIKIFRKNNTIKLIGYNTDVYGFQEPLVDVLKPVHKKALILGTGGASKAVAWVLKNLGIEFSFISRNPKSVRDFKYGEMTSKQIEDFKILINTSPVGMFPNIKDCPNLPYKGVTKDHILYDLVYNPEVTSFLQKGEEKKATLINGLPMLYLQAEKAWEIWNKF